MSRGYDKRTTTFSPEGRLLQVEYAMEAINKAGAAVGFMTNDGIILACEKQDVSALLEQSTSKMKFLNRQTVREDLPSRFAPVLHHLGSGFRRQLPHRLR